MKNLIVIGFCFYVNVAVGQYLMVGIDFGTGSSASFLHSQSSISDLTPDFVGLYYKADLLWDSRKWAHTLQGIRLENKTSVVSSPLQEVGSFKTGLYYVVSTGFDFISEEEYGIGLIGSVGPHLHFSSARGLLNYNLGLSSRMGISFKTRNYRMLEIGYNLSYDLLGVFGTPSSNDYKFVSTGFSLGFSSPINKVNGTTFFDRRKADRRIKPKVRKRKTNK